METMASDKKDNLHKNKISKRELCCVLAEQAWLLRGLQVVRLLI